MMLNCSRKTCSSINKFQVNTINRNLILPPTIASIIEDLNSCTLIQNSEIVDSIILELDYNLNVIFENGKIFNLLSEVMRLIKDEFIPIMRVEDERTAENLIDYIQHKVEGYDFIVMSSKPELVKLIFAKTQKGFGAIIFDKIDNINNKQDLIKIISTINANSARIAVLPQQILTRQNIEFLQKRMISVWSCVDQDSDFFKNKKDIYNYDIEPVCININKAITMGVNGIIISNPIRAKKRLEIFENALTRKELLIAHRGASSLAPENTMESFRIAYELGADIIEMDVQVTKDNRLIAMHDNTLIRTTNYVPKRRFDRGEIRDITLEEIKGLSVNKPFPDKYPDAKVPTLDEVFDEFKGKDVVILIDIKTWQENNMEELLVDLIKEKEMQDQIVINSFIKYRIKRMRELMPELSIGFLDFSLLIKNDTKTSFELITPIIQKFNVSYNPQYDNLTEEFINIMCKRGVIMWPWTFNNVSDAIKYFIIGVDGLIANIVDVISKWDIYLEAENEIRINVNQVKEIFAKVVTYGKSIREVKPEIIRIANNGNHEKNNNSLKIEGNFVKALSKGEYYLVLKYKTSINGNSYNLYSEVVTIIVE